MVKSLLLALAITQLTGCATLNPNVRIAGGVLLGGAIGASAGAALSPNDESRALNALVFGLTGALVGGGIAVWTSPENKATEPKSDLRARELGQVTSGKEYLVTPRQELPEFLKQRVQPVVIEEFTEKDSVTEEGILHEPHKAYRIKRQAELLANPTSPNAQKEGGP